MPTVPPPRARRASVAGVEAALIGLALVFGAIGAYAAPRLSPDLAKVLADGLSVATSASAWPTIPCVIALVLAVRRSGALPKSVTVVGLGVAALHAVTAVGFARAGLLSPSGIALAAPPAFWMLVIGAGLLRRPLALTAAAPVAA
jgi:stage V sporulation protein SpoVS